VSFRCKSLCAVIRNTSVYTLLLRLRHSTEDWAHKCKSIENGLTGDFCLRNREKTSNLFQWYCYRRDGKTADMMPPSMAGRPAAKQPLSLRHSLILFSISAMSVIRPFLGFSVSLPYFLPFFPFVSKWCLLCLTFCVAANVASLCSLSPPVTTGPTVSPIAVTLLRRMLDWVQLSGLDLLWVLLEAWIRTHKMWRFPKARVLQNAALFFRIVSSWAWRHDRVTPASYFSYVSTAKYCAVCYSCRSVCRQCLEANTAHFLWNSSLWTYNKTMVICIYCLRQ